MFSFPNPVNEKAARVVAFVVMVVAIVALLTGAHWLLVALAVGFIARTHRPTSVRWGAWPRR